MKNRLFPLVALVSPMSVYAESGLERIAFEAAGGALVGVTLALIGTVAFYLYRGAKKAKKAAAPKVEHFKKTTLPKARNFAARTGASISGRVRTEEEKVLEIADEFFESASEEISQNAQKPGLWLKSLALAEGDESKQKAIYIRLRAKQLSETPSVDKTLGESPEDKAQEPAQKRDKKQAKHEARLQAQAEKREQRMASILAKVVADGRTNLEHEARVQAMLKVKGMALNPEQANQKKTTQLSAELEQLEERHQRTEELDPKYVKHLERIERIRQEQAQAQARERVEARRRRESNYYLIVLITILVTLALVLTVAMYI